MATLKIRPRPHEITESFLQELDKHLADIVEGRRQDMFEIRDFAAILHIHPTHLTNTVKQITGRTPCDFFEDRILERAKNLLAGTDLPINEVATLLTYDPSNFTKFFKRFSGQTPKQYREEVRATPARRVLTI
ncbi:helix-turn-helix domain-containing protein [Dinghuibacter silviterrae]|uniref:AraC-like DNA-binding protein n=1 Tax=Dinghuibacter silviterrae TaxID=1539049 RepID=A0A4V6Q9U8_9BACT|nr:helix-turn-helix transcriptional regulator [Dinghuibacter silviterrae]TDW95952.1 AraC-like DNA-binding protein [Dinghuibacter silviterrae]